jgi:hypothetical protein
MPAHAVVPQAPVVRQRPITAVDPAYAEDPGSGGNLPVAACFPLLSGLVSGSIVPLYQF